MRSRTLVVAESEHRNFVFSSETVRLRLAKESRSVRKHLRALSAVWAGVAPTMSAEISSSHWSMLYVKDAAWSSFKGAYKASLLTTGATGHP